MPVLRIAALFAVAALLLACTPQPTASQLAAKGVANLNSAKTVHQADTTKMLEEVRKSAGASSQPISNPQGTGELWIRIEHRQGSGGDVARHALLASRRGGPPDHGASGRALGGAAVQTGSKAVTSSRSGGRVALTPA